MMLKILLYVSRVFDDTCFSSNSGFICDLIDLGVMEHESKKMYGRIGNVCVITVCCNSKSGASN